MDEGTPRRDQEIAERRGPPRFCYVCDHLGGSHDRWGRCRIGLYNHAEPRCGCKEYVSDKEFGQVHLIP